MIRIEDLRYAPGGAPIVDGFSAAFAPGAITALVGPSGCGKSTLLRLVAGLRPADGGRIQGVPAERAFVFQDPALLPWLDARGNVALPGRYGPIGDVDEALAQVGLTEHATKLPGALSGGQRMRVSLARALVSRPELVLLDEPFSALDGVTRRGIIDQFVALQLRYKWTVLLVTHDLAEAARMADRVLALTGPPLRVVADVAAFSPRPRPRPEPGVLERLEAVWAADLAPQTR